MSEIRKIGRRIGEDLKIWLPGETPWSIVERIHSDGTLSVKINNDLVLTDEHGYKFADIVRVEQEVTPEYSIWKVIAPESVDEALVTPALQGQDKVAELIERLRQTAVEWTDLEYGPAFDSDLIIEAGAALEAQQAENARLRELLSVQTIWVEACLERFGPWDGDQREAAKETCDLSRAALAEPGS